jgi:ABC-type multidrug transport system fused ATPase/permease subunit
VPPQEKEVVGQIQLKNVKFSYPTKKDVEVLKGVSIVIQKNKVIALVGPSGKKLYNLKHFIYIKDAENQA